MIFSRDPCEDCLTLHFPQEPPLIFTAEMRDSCRRSPAQGHVDCLRHAHEQGMQWHPVITAWASYNGRLECLRYAHENGCPWHEDTCAFASEGGHLDCLRYAHENGAPWNEETCSWGAREGRLECLRYAHQNGCPWDEWTCSQSAQHGQLDCLRYAHEHGAPWDDDTCRWACYDGELECLRYALENGCPAPDFSIHRVHPRVVAYLHHRGFRLNRDDHHLKNHIRKHVKQAITLLRCAVILLTSYREACERVYSPDGVGYREAELSFRSLVGEGSDDDVGAVNVSGEFAPV